ncbi:MAG: hypothetical protein EU535_07805, partial [Promethearchaeota archaeon]
KDKEKISVQSPEDQEIDSQIEALLYIARRPVSLDEIQEVIPNKSKEQLLNIIYQLIERYYEYNSALEIVELSNLRFELTLKDYVVNSIEHFTLGNMLKPSEIKTLSVIAYFQPDINRTQLYEHLGNTSRVYQSIRSLKKLNFVNEMKKRLHLTDHFYDYFKLDSKDLDLVKSFLDYFKS